MIADTATAHGPSRVRLVFRRLAGAMNAVGTLWIVALMLLINADVLGRALFNSPIAGVPEMVSLSIVGIVFLQLAHTAETGRLTRSTSLVDALARRPRVLAGLEAAYGLCGTAVSAVMTQAGLSLFLNAWNRHEMVGEFGNFQAPLWPVRLIVLVGCAMLTLHFLGRIAGGLRRMTKGGSA